MADGAISASADTAASLGATTAAGSVGDQVRVALTAFPTTAITAETWVRSTAAANQQAILLFAESTSQNNE